jgi:ligand-binding SRPBCC domain-containing protein
MPTVQSTVDLNAVAGRVFAVLLRPENLVRLAPPDLGFRLLEAPEALTVGARVAIGLRRWGVTLRLETEVTTLEADRLLVEEQRRGPFRRWTVTRRLEPLADGGTRLSDAVDFEPPGGVLGLALRAGTIERDLAWLFEHRREALAEMLREGPPIP